MFEPGFGFERYVDYALDVPMYFAYREGRYVDATGQSFRDFLVGRLPALPGQLASVADWEAHLTTIFPEVRLKRFLEMRGADNGLKAAICALPALWVGLLYDEEALEEAWQLVRDWSAGERAALRAAVPVHALAAPFRGAAVRDVARRVVAIARGGLQRRGLGEEAFLAGLEAIAESGVTAADAMLAEYGRTGSVGFVFDSRVY